MSKFVKVKTELRDVNHLKRALEDLKLGYAEDAQYRHLWSRHSEVVPLLVSQDRLSFGFRQTSDGLYEVVGDDMQLKQIKGILAQVQQRYAYHKVLAEVESAGFSLVEEKVGSDQVIRMTVRRWNE